MSNKFQNQDFKSEAELISAGATKSSLLNTTKIYSPKSLDVLETVLRKNNFAGSVAPAVTDDSSQGYEVGSVWIDIVGEKSYNCISNGVGTALWKEGGGGVATSNGLTAIVEILNNQVAPVNTGIVFSYPTIKSFEVFAQIIRTTDSDALTEVTKILGVYDIATNAWILTDVAANNSGVSFSITAIGEIQYISTNLAGATYIGEMAYSYQANGGAISGTSPNDLSAEGLNYISKGNAESGTNGWLTYSDAAAAKPVDGTGGAANITFAESSVAPLRGLKSFLLSKDAVNRQGEGVGYNFTIDNASKAKVLTIEFDYIVNSGTFVAGTRTTTSDLIAYIYDVTNNVLIEPSSIKLLSNSTTVADKFSATFQTAHNSNNYRLIFHCASTSALAYSLKIDNIKVSPSNYIYGTPITDWQSYIPIFTGFGIATSIQFFYRRVGSNIEITGKFTSGTPTAVEARISLPQNIVADPTYSPSIKTTGEYININLSTNSHGGAILIEPSVSYITFGNPITYGSGSINPITKVNGTDVQGVGASMSLKASIPIQGWSSSVQMSDSADTRVCVAHYFCSANKSASSSVPFDFDSKIIDTHGAVTTGAGWKFTAPVAGFYKIGLFVNGLTSTGAYFVYYKNNTGPLPIGYSSNPSTQTVSCSTIVELKAGDFIDIRTGVSSVTAVGAAVLTQNTSNMTIERVTGPSAIAANESVIATYSTDAGQTMPVGTQTTVNFGTKIVDTHGAVTVGAGWVFTAPISGTYELSSKILMAIGSRTALSYIDLYLVKNAAIFGSFRTTIYAAGSHYPSGSMPSTLVPLLAGETLKINISNNGIASSLHADGLFNNISIKRVGN